jgi:hypothetical protein
LALAFGLSTLITCAATGATPPPGPLDFKGVRLGMTLAAWKALPFPGSTSSRARPVCTDGADAISSGLLPARSDLSAETVVCAYFSQYGRFMLPDPVALGPRIVTRRLRFTFEDGRLSAIEYRTSVNAYDDLAARLNTRYGPSARLTRDSVKTSAGAYPRVRRTWQAPDGQIELIDPVAPYTDLSLRLSVPQAARHGRAS